MAAKVSQVCADSLAVIHDTRTPKPVNVLIITDGIAGASPLVDTTLKTDLTDETHQLTTRTFSTP